MECRGAVLATAFAFLSESQLLGLDVCIKMDVVVSVVQLVAGLCSASGLLVQAPVPRVGLGWLLCTGNCASVTARLLRVKLWGSREEMGKDMRHIFLETSKF